MTFSVGRAMRCWTARRNRKLALCGRVVQEAQQPVLRRYTETRYGAKPRSLLTAPPELQRGE